MRAWILHPDIKAERSRRLPEHGLAEAVSLAGALPGMQVLGAEVVRLSRIHPGTLFGSGKLDELKARFKAEGVELVLVDGPVSPIQQRNLEKEWGVKLLDRTSLILEIFADRARTREGVLQVELAALSYQRTRLVRAWTHLERQRGGFGFVGGPGETQKEADRRAIDDQVIRIKRQLEKVVKTRELHRSARRKVPFPIVALVGYTNAGKSTLFNAVTGSEVFAADQLFATLDPTLRRLDLADLGPIVLADTVGFIRHLPHKLVEAFRSTLEESSNSDLLLHVIDAHEPERMAQIEQVMVVLGEIGAQDLPILEVYNKIDLLEAVEPQIQRDADGKPQRVWLSARDGAGLELLEQAIAELLGNDLFVATLRLPQRFARLRAQFFELGAVQKEAHDDEGVCLLDVRLPRAELNRLVSREGLEPAAFIEEHTLQ